MGSHRAKLLIINILYENLCIFMPLEALLPPRKGLFKRISILS